MARWIVGVDVGGTFTDFSARDLISGQSFVHKRPSTPDDPSRAVLDGFAELRANVGIDSADVERFAHGTTVAANSLLQRTGGKLAVITTEGFRDLLEIGRQIRPRIYDLQVDAPPPLVPRRQRLEIRERIGADGEAVIDLEDDAIAQVVEQLGRLEGIEGCAVCLLFSFRNPEHERRIGAALKRRYPTLHVSLSSSVQPEFREYERFSTTVINAFLQPKLSQYMGRLKTAIAEAAPAANFGVFQSSGGLMSVERAAEFPVRTALSGPAAGVVGAAASASLSSVDDVITFDMGGTSTDVCLIRDGKASMAGVRDIAGFRIRLPMIDIHTVGAGGGSIAHMGPDGLLKVGPKSAGAVPGPACYCRGGTEPTVSDANLVLGRLPGSLVGGGMTLDRPRAVGALRGLAEELGISVEKTALGIAGIVTSNMVRAIRAVSVERGHDPRDFVLMPFGGAGGLHAADVARELGMTRILIPRSPGILCAEGLVVADLQESFVGMCRMTVEGSLQDADTVLGQLVDQARSWFESESVAPDRRTLALNVDMRYVGQNYELPVAIAGDQAKPELPDAAILKRLFFDVHERSYGHHDPDAPVEIINVRLLAVAKLSHADWRDTLSEAGHRAPDGGHAVWFADDEPVFTPVYERASLQPGFSLQGPAIITQIDATTLVPPWARLEVDSASNMILEIDQ